MTINNGTVTDVRKGTQAFDEVYYGNILVFERYLPTGTVLWQGPNAFTNAFSDVSTSGNNPGAYHVPANDKILLGQSIVISQPLDKLRTGITININPNVLGGTFSYSGTYREWSESSAIGSYPTSGTINATTITAAQIKARTAVKIATGSYYTVYAQAVDDSHLKFYSQSSSKTYDNSTIIGWNDSGDSIYRSLLIIDSLTAY